VYNNTRGHTIVQWNGLLILFGGGEYGRTFNDLWVLDLKSHQPDQSNGNWIMNRSWKQINAYTLDDDAEVSVQPLGRSGHACLVMQTHYMYIFGGYVNEILFYYYVIFHTRFVSQEQSYSNIRRHVAHRFTKSIGVFLWS
jgi:hypothetical protein